MYKFHVLCIILFFMIISVFAQEARPTWRGGYTKSLGQPIKYKPYLGFSVGAYSPKNINLLTTQFRAGIYKDLMNPVYGGIGWSAEGYIGHRNVDLDYGLRGFLEIPVIRLAAGYDYNFIDKGGDLILRMTFLLNRGGVFGRGTDVRLEYLPTRGHSYQVGIGVPIFQPNIGKTRAKKEYVKLAIPDIPVKDVPVDNGKLKEALSQIKESAHWINRLSTPYFDQSGKDAYQAIGVAIDEIKVHLNEKNELFPNGRDVESEIRVYHKELDRAFSIAVSGQSLEFGQSTIDGIATSKKAKEILLQEIIIPYNRLLGQRKKKDTILEYGVLARGALARWLHTADTVPVERVEAVRHIFNKLIEIIEESREYSAKTWQDSRLIWLPLQFVYLPEEHDTQSEIDAIIEKFVEVPFTDGNRLWYIINEQFQLELARQIHAARDYHVLWIHDVDGYNAENKPDTISFLQVKEGYLRAMTERIKEYDKTGKLPVYMIFLDQVFYESNGGRLWMNLLEDPLNYKLSLSDKLMEAAMRQAQGELNKAVSESKLLQAEVEQYGKKWLKNLVKVHVNITNPADNSFWNAHVIPVMGTPDNIMRDHRKISFYDICEENPYKGMAIYTGMGVGEHYSGATWDDRAMMVRGPVTLNLKYAAINLLLNQGFEEHEIPYPLRRRDIPYSYHQAVNDTINKYHEKGIVLGRAMELHNQTGFHAKHVSMIKALLANLLPKGAISYTPDSLWNSTLFASLLVGNALRGGGVVIIAPSLECAPSAGFPQMSRAQGLFARLIVIQDKLKDEINAAGGLLQTSIYDPEVDVADIPGLIAAFRKHLNNNPDKRDLYNFHPSFYTMLDSMHQALSKFKAVYITSDAQVRRPKLHAKINMFISVDALMKIMSRPEFTEVMRIYLEQQALDFMQTSHDERLFEQEEELRVVVYKWLIAAKEQLSEEDIEKFIVYFMVGTMNHDYMSMMLNGEAVILVSGWHSIHGLIDIIFKSGHAKKVKTLAELEEYLPQQSSIKRWIGDWIKYML